MIKRFVANQTSLGKKLLFIAAVGDNFYWNGVNPVRRPFVCAPARTQHFGNAAVGTVSVTSPPLCSPCIRLPQAVSWETQWAGPYGSNDPASPLNGVPWLAVMGNHVRLRCSYE